MKERGAAVLRIMCSQTVQRMLGDRRCGKLLVSILAEEVFELFNVVASALVKLTLGLRILHVEQMPLARMIAAVSHLPQVVRKQALPGGPVG